MTTHDRRTLLRAIGAASIGGATLLSGTASGATVTVLRGAGEDIWGTSDEGHYYYAQVSGDFDVTVRNTFIEDIESWTKGGPMVRESLDSDSKNVMVRRRPNGEASVQWRPETGAETSSTGGTTADWLRLQRSGDTITAYHSTDGSNWTTIETFGSGDVQFSDTVYLGLALTSHLSGTLATARYQDLSGVDPTNSQDIGDVEVDGSASTETGVPLVSASEPTNVTATSATFNGELLDLGDADSAECYFEYREVPTAEWEATESQTLTSTGSFNTEVSGLTGRRYYQIRAVAETSDGDTATETLNRFSTPNPSSGDGPGGDVESASYFDLDDGFAEPAPWLDDQTPIVKITEPTREMFERADVEGERLIVFETSGVVDLGYSPLVIENDKCWIAGQTAPSPGFIFIKGTVQIAASDCVVQHIGSYRGEQEGPGEGKDALNTGDETTNNVIDHVSAFWGRDENLSVGYRTENTTVTNCLSAEGLGEPAENSNGSLIGDNATNVALMGNVWAKNIDRNPRLKTGTESVVVNNIMYYFDDAVTLDESTVSSVVGNGFLDTVQPSDPAIHHGRFYVEDNYADPEINPLYEADELLSERPLWPEGLEALPSEEVLEHNMENVGARPADRIEPDRRVLQDVAEGTGEFIGSQADVGGYPSLPTNSRPVNVPRSGVRHWLTVQAMQVEQPAMDYYQVDFAAGDPIEDLRAGALYADQDRLMRFAHGSLEEGITDKGTAWPSAEIRECLEYGHISETGDGTASVTFTVAEGCERMLSLAVYRTPNASFSLETVDEQVLVHSTTETYGPGEHTITVDLPTDG